MDKAELLAVADAFSTVLTEVLNRHAKRVNTQVKARSVAITRTYESRRKTELKWKAAVSASLKKLETIIRQLIKKER